MGKKPSITARVLSPAEYPANLTGTRGLWGRLPTILFATQHPLGLYSVEDEGANVHGVYFTPRRAKKPQRIATASSMSSAFRRISDHEDRLLHPEAVREEGKQGPVSIYALGQRTQDPKPKSELDRELDAWLLEHGYTPQGSP